ncbi:hypothetical protein [Acinetobacter sp. IK31]|nr:hypothetical protein [Acinetobacter sp. IK31]
MSKTLKKENVDLVVVIVVVVKVAASLLKMSLKDELMSCGH